jgi:hypothetical protein
MKKLKTATAAIGDLPVFFTPSLLAQRWYWNVESVRRKIRRGEIASVVIGRRRLVTLAEIARLEADGSVNATNRGS